MKLRIEKSGYHWFDRVSGLHILDDRVRPEVGVASIAPRTLSVALSNACDLKCHFCYRPKNGNRLPPEFVQEIARVADALGTLEITFGGGEPLLYRELDFVCEWIWRNTSLAISMTTHGHWMSREVISRLKGRLSSIRFSIDGPEPYYSAIRGRSLASLTENIRAIGGAIPFGVNVVVSPGHVAELRAVAEIAVDIGAGDLLIIPEHDRGRPLLSVEEWREVGVIIAEYQPLLSLSATFEAIRHLTCSFLETERDGEFSFAHISASGELRRNSYELGGILVSDSDRLGEYFCQLQAGG